MKQRQASYLLYFLIIYVLNLKKISLKSWLVPCLLVKNIRPTYILLTQSLTETAITSPFGSQSVCRQVVLHTVAIDQMGFFHLKDFNTNLDKKMSF
jgi:hypothetical protein